MPKGWPALHFRTSAVEININAIDLYFFDELDCFGLDQKVLLLAERAGRHVSVAKTYYRPVQEPILASMWDKLAGLDFDAGQAAEVASLLVGSRQQIRTKPMAGKAPDGSAFVFAKCPDPNWIGKLRSCAADADGAIELAAKLFQVVIYEHPFTDGNGRFSRAMIYAALARFGLIRNPSLGLNGVFELHRDAMALALRSSHSLGSPVPLMEVITTMLEDSVSLVRTLLDRPTAGAVEA